MSRPRLAALALLAVPALAACDAGDPPRPAEDDAPPAGADAAAPGLPAALPAEGVVARVDGTPVTAEEVRERVEVVVAERTGGRPLPPQQAEELRRALAPSVLDALIEERLLDRAAAAAGIDPDEATYRRKMEESLEVYLVESGITREEFAERVQTVEGTDVEGFVTEQTADPGFRRAVRHAQLLRSVHPERVAVTDAEVEERYRRDLESRYTRPEAVRARHVLIEAPEGTPSAEVAEAERRAQEVRALALAPDADFTALAREHSEGPSAPSGGELGWFPRDGVMVEPFAAAAFALQPGEVGEVVRTPFGFHVIQVVDRRPAHVVPLEDAAQAIRTQLEVEKLAEVRASHVESLRAGAEIEIVGA